MIWRKILIGTWSWKRPFISLLSTYLLLSIFAAFFINRIIFMPPPSSYSPDLPGLVRVPTAAAEQIAILHLPAAPTMPTILYSHGNAEDLGHAADLYDQLQQRGFGLVAYDYPGYGQSSGTPSQQSCQRAIQTVWDHLRAAGVSADSIILVGRSVGSGPSTWLAAKQQPAGLILISPFTSIHAVRIPIPIFLGDKFPNLKIISRTSTPLLVIHGELDELIDSSHGRKLVAASPATDKAFYLVPNADHNNIFDIAAADILQHIQAFSKRVSPETPDNFTN